MKFFIAFALLAVAAADVSHLSSKGYLPPVQNTNTATQIVHSSPSLEITQSSPALSYSIRGVQQSLGGQQLQQIISAPAAATYSTAPGFNYVLSGGQNILSGLGSPSLGTYGSAPGITYTLASPSTIGSPALQTLNYGTIQQALGNAGLQATYGGIPTINYATPSLISGSSLIAGSSLLPGSTLLSGSTLLGGPAGLTGPSIISSPLVNTISSGIDTRYANNGGYLYKKK